ncbi:MAG: hypothetical protein CMQ53_00615 [Gammaproteobacteria bacterium]|nr:hypothetical protein [Gammaproteobacteria bacterium]
MFKGEINAKNNDHERTYGNGRTTKKTEAQIKTKTKKAGKIMTMKRHQMMRKLRQAQLRAKDPEFKMLWLQKQRQLELSTESTPVSPNN